MALWLLIHMQCPQDSKKLEEADFRIKHFIAQYSWGLPTRLIGKVPETLSCKTCCLSNYGVSDNRYETPEIPNAKCFSIRFCAFTVLQKKDMKRRKSESENICNSLLCIYGFPAKRYETS